MPEGRRQGDDSGPRPSPSGFGRAEDLRTDRASRSRSILGRRSVKDGSPGRTHPDLDDRRHPVFPTSGSRVVSVRSRRGAKARGGVRRVDNRSRAVERGERRDAFVGRLGRGLVDQLPLRQELADEAVIRVGVGRRSGLVRGVIRRERSRRRPVIPARDRVEARPREHHQRMEGGEGDYQGLADRSRRHHEPAQDTPLFRSATILRVPKALTPWSQNQGADSPGKVPRPSVFSSRPRPSTPGARVWMSLNSCGEDQDEMAVEGASIPRESLGNQVRERLLRPFEGAGGVGRCVDSVRGRRL